MIYRWIVCLAWNNFLEINVYTAVAICKFYAIKLSSNYFFIETCQYLLIAKHVVKSMSPVENNVFQAPSSFVALIEMEKYAEHW